MIMKKTAKCLISVLLIVAMMAGMFLFTSFAATDVLCIKSTANKISQNEEFELTLYFPSKYDKAATLDFALNYDSNTFEFVSLKKGEGLTKARSAEDIVDVYAEKTDKLGEVRWILASSKNYSFSGEFAKIVFKVKNFASDGTAKFTLKVNEAYSAQLKDVSSTFTVSSFDVNVHRDAISDMTFEYNDDMKGFVIVGYNSIKSYEMNIPSVHNMLPVVGIADGVFENHAEIKSLTIPETIKFIGKNAFKGCSGFETLVLPISLTEISDYAFADCSELKNLELPYMATKIGEGAFSDCTKLASVYLPFTLTEIGAEAFNRCAVLETVYISKNTSTIGEDAFGSCGGADYKMNFVTVGNSALESRIAADKIDAEITTVEDLSLGHINDIKDTKYTGSEIKPAVTVTLDNGKPVAKDSEYAVRYFNNKNSGTAVVVVIGQNGYGEGYISTFEILCEHQWKTTVLAEATCETAGSVYSVCSVCGKTKLEISPATGHSGETIVEEVRPTVFEKGSGYKFCDVCKKTYGDKIILPKVHPDLNNDSFINSTDALEVLRYTVKLENIITTNEIFKKADTDANDIVNTVDALNILQIAVGKITLD